MPPDPRYIQYIKNQAAKQADPSNPGLTGEALAGIASQIYNLHPDDMAMPAGMLSKYNIDDPTNTTKLIAGAVHYLADMYQRFNDWDKAVAAYRSGAPATVEAPRDPAYMSNRELQQLTGKSHPTWKDVKAAEANPEANNFNPDKLPKEIQDFVDEVNYPKLPAKKPNSSSATGDKFPEPQLSDYLDDPTYSGNPNAARDAFYSTHAKWQADTKASLSNPFLENLLAEMSHEIAAGNLTVNAASDQFKNMMSAYDSANSVYKSDVFKYGAAPGQKYVSGTEPGNSLGLEPIDIGPTVPMNPFATANAQVSGSPNLNDLAARFTNPAGIAEARKQVGQPVASNLASVPTSADTNAPPGAPSNGFAAALAFIQAHPELLQGAK